MLSPFRRNLQCSQESKFGIYESTLSFVTSQMNVTSEKSLQPEIKYIDSSISCYTGSSIVEFIQKENKDLKISLYHVKQIIAI